MATTSRIDGPYPRAYERFPTIRQSTLSAFDACGLSAHFESEMRRGWSTHAQARGSVIHRVFAECMRQMWLMQEPRIEVDVALEILHQTLRQADVDRECPKCEGSNILPGIDATSRRTCGDCGEKFPTGLMNLPAQETDTIRMVVIKWAHENTWPIETLIDVEQRLSMEVEYPGVGDIGVVRRTYTGQMDVAFLDPNDPEHLIVPDYKSGWKLPPPTELSFEGYFQQQSYAALALTNYKPIARVTTREIYVNYNEVREATTHREDLPTVTERLAEKVETFDRAVHEQVFVPTPGAHCNWCMRPTACTIKRLGRGDGSVTTPEEAERAAATIVVAEAALKHARGALKGYADVNGPIPIRDAKGRRLLGFVEQERTQRPTREEYLNAVAMGLDPLKLYSTKKGTRFTTFVPKREQRSDEDEAFMSALRATVEGIQERGGAGGGEQDP